jgi:hypothetical protein
MSAEELADRLIALSEAGGPIDWREMREQILAEHKKAPDESDRVLCLNLHHALLNFAERNAIEPHELEAFRETGIRTISGCSCERRWSERPATTLIRQRCLPLQREKFAMGECVKTMNFTS